MTHGFLRPYGGGGAAGGSLWAKRSGDLELFYPRNADADTVQGVGAGSPWDWGAWSQIVASTSEDFVPVRLHTQYAIGQITGSAVDVTIIEHEIASGATDEEVTIFRSYFHMGAIIVNPGASTIAVSYVAHSPPFGPAVIPSGTRLSQRIRSSQNPSDQLLLGATTFIAGHQDGDDIQAYNGYDLMQHLAGDHDARVLTIPSGSGVNIQADAFATGYGDWVEVIDEADSDLMLMSVTRDPTAPSGARSTILELGVGAEDEESPIGRLAFPGGDITPTGNAGFSQPYRPLVVLQGERAAARTTGNGTTMPYYFTWMELS